MAYRFGSTEGLAAATARVSEEQLARAVRRLREDAAEDAVEAVHDARKAVKKERALLRLMRGQLPRKARRRENRALRDASRRLSDARDAEVLVDTLDALAAHDSGQLPAAAFAAVREPLLARREASRATLDDPRRLDAAASELDASRRRVSELSRERAGLDGLVPGLRRTYRRGERSFAAARAAPDKESLHAWRKRVKDLWYELRLLAEMGGKIVEGHGKDAHALADLLGDDHDLAVLRDAIAGLSAIHSDEVIALIDRRRTELQGEAFRLGRRVYAETARHFVARMHASVSAARRETSDA